MSRQTTKTDIQRIGRALGLLLPSNLTSYEMVCASEKRAHELIAAIHALHPELGDFDVATAFIDLSVHSPKKDPPK